MFKMIAVSCLSVLAITACGRDQSTSTVASESEKEQAEPNIQFLLGKYKGETGNFFNKKACYVEVSVETFGFGSVVYKLSVDGSDESIKVEQRSEDLAKLVGEGKKTDQFAYNPGGGALLSGTVSYTDTTWNDQGYTSISSTERNIAFGFPIGEKSIACKKLVKVK